MFGSFSTLFSRDSRRWVEVTNEQVPENTVIQGSLSISSYVHHVLICFSISNHRVLAAATEKEAESIGDSAASPVM